MKTLASHRVFAPKDATTFAEKIAVQAAQLRAGRWLVERIRMRGPSIHSFDIRSPNGITQTVLYEPRASA